MRQLISLAAHHSSTIVLDLNLMDIWHSPKSPPVQINWPLISSIAVSKMLQEVVQFTNYCVYVSVQNTIHLKVCCWSLAWVCF
jgi:hypothetical protein